MKICSKCRNSLMETDFQIIGKKPDGNPRYKAMCNACYNKHYREKYRSQPAHIKKKLYAANKANTTFESRKAYKLKRYYDMTMEDYYGMLSNQKNCCYICDKAIEGNLVRIDHDHTTGKVRKLLCNSCNSALGMLNENPALFMKCIEYLEEHAC